MLTLLSVLLSVLLFFLPLRHTNAGQIIAPITWKQTVGQPLYDTPSGNLDLGYYVTQDDGTILAYQATTTVTTATTTYAIPTGLQAVKQIPLGYKPAHIVGTQYVDSFSDGSQYVGDPVVDGALSQPNAPIPSAAVDAANSTQIVAPSL